MRMFKIAVLLSSLCITVSAAAGPADKYPERPLRIVVPFVAGGGGDFIARAWADKLSELIKQPVIIENRGGGNTVVGTEQIR